MKLLALLEDLEGPSARHRFHAYRQEWRCGGFESQAEQIPRDRSLRRKLLRSSAAHDLVFVQRRLLPPWEVGYLRRHSRALVYDFDDALDRRDRAPFASLSRRFKFRAWMRAADLVLAGNDYLARSARSAGARWVERAPTTLHRSAARVPSRDSTTVILLWIGQPSTFHYLLPHLLELDRRRNRVPGLRLEVLGIDELQRTRVPTWVHAVPWTLEEERRALERATVGLAPLPDDPWTRGKCGLRLLHCLGAGLPTVASDVGAQREIAQACGGTRLVQPGTSLWAGVEEILADWVHWRRRAESAAGRVAEHYGAGPWSLRTMDWLEQACKVGFQRRR